MAGLRKLPSGKWQATVRGPDGRRHTKTDKLKSVVEHWAAEEERRIRLGQWADPTLTRVTYDTWRDRWLEARVVEPETARHDRGIIKNHLDPHWSGQVLASITRLAVQGWVRKLSQDGTGPHVIRKAHALFGAMMNAAVLEGIVTASPARKIDLPATPVKHPAWFTQEQAHQIINALPERHGVAAALMFYTGLRWGEMAGLRIGDVDFGRRRVRVSGARTQDGRWKDYPKSSRSRREVPVPSWLLDLLQGQVRGRGVGESLFVTERRGSPWSASNWRKVWYEALQVAGAPAHGPHTCRHSCASWLVQAGVPLYDVQRLLGHESFSTTMRYAHLAPDAFAAVETVWTRVPELTSGDKDERE